jgi:hypothetical protein
MLEEAYKTYVGRVLKETSVTEDAKTSEKETKVLAEGKKTDTKIEGSVKTGDSQDQLLSEKEIDKADEKQSTMISESTKLHLRRLAGLV